MSALPGKTPRSGNSDETSAPRRSRPYNIGVSANYDVLIAGGGMAGCAAAIAAARESASVLLVEQHGYLGGNATRAMVQPWQSFHAALTRPDGGLPQQVIGGIAQEFVDDLVALGASPGHIVDPIGFAGSLTPVDSEALKLYLPGKLREAGVELRLATPLTRELADQAGQIVDATGSAAAARLLGAKVAQPQDAQPYSWLFTMTGVDCTAVRAWQLAHLEEFVLHPAFAKLRPDYAAISGFFSLVREAQQAGEFSIPRDRLLFFSTPREGEVLINTTRIAADHPQPQIEGLRQVHELASWLPQRVPGCASARLGRLADSIGERESYRIVGRATLSAADVASDAPLPDAVARGCYRIDIHRSSDSGLQTQDIAKRGWYDLPLGCLQSVNVPRLLAAGRCISADRYGFASARALPTAIATGQAAGMIAAWRAQKKEIEYSACLSRISLV